MGVASRSCGSAGRPCGRPAVTAGCGRGAIDKSSGTGLFNGLPLAVGGIASPRRGVRLPLPLRFPGIGGRRSGAGADMLIWIKTTQNWSCGRSGLDMFHPCSRAAWTYNEGR